MKENIEEFKKKIIESKQSTISLDDSAYFSRVLKIQEQHGSDFKPKEKLTLFGCKNLCPNCSKELHIKYLGQKWDRSSEQFIQYYINQCIRGCTYEYAHIEFTDKSK